MANKKSILDDDIMVTIELDDGTALDCEIHTIFEIGEQSYIVVEPAKTFNDPNCTDADIYVYRYFEDENGNYSLENIVDDEEYEMVSEKLDELMDEDYFDELFSDDDEDQ